MPRLLASLRSRVFLGAALAAVLPMAAALAFVTSRATGQAEAELQGGLEEAARLVAQYQRMRVENARERALLLADLPKLKAAVATGDPPTVEPLARDYRSSVGSDALAVFDASGRPLASIGAPPSNGAGQGPSAAREATLVVGGRLLQTVTVPILLGAPAPELLGHLTLGFALDDAFASRLRALTGCQVAVAQAGRIHASTLPREHDAALSATPSRRVVRLDLGGEEYVARREPLWPGPAQPEVLVLRSRAEALGTLRTLQTALAVAALSALTGSLLLSYALSRTVTRPLAALTDAMKQVAATGDLTRKIGPGRSWDDEDARVVARSFNTLTDSIAYFQRQAALRERLSALGQLSAVVAHEVRNPLMIIRGALRTLRKGDAGSEGLREAVADIDHEVSRLDRIVGDVLDFARPLAIEAAPTDLDALLRDAVGAALAADCGVSARIVVADSLGSLVTDGERLRMALVNLVANGRDSVLARRAQAPAVPQAGEPLEVGGRRLDGGRVLLWVEDRGTGIAPADLARAFEPFFTTKRGGSGLGLAITRKVVEALGGSIRLTSRAGEGARVEIELGDVAAGFGRKEA